MAGRGSAEGSGVSDAGLPEEERGTGCTGTAKVVLWSVGNSPGGGEAGGIVERRLTQKTKVRALRFVVKKMCSRIVRSGRPREWSSLT